MRRLRKTIVFGMLGLISVGGVLVYPGISADAAGSRNLVDNDGYRPYLEWKWPEDAPYDSTAGIERKTVLYVYAKAGEQIDVGSSVYAANPEADIVLIDPNKVIYNIDVLETGEGFIPNIIMENNGPNTINAGGYTPRTVPVTQNTEGLWEVHFQSNRNIGDNNPTPVRCQEQFPLGLPNGNPGHSVASWDVTVRDGNVAKTGRVFADYLALNMGTNSQLPASPTTQIALKSHLYILTRDGFLYRTDLNGMDPFGFIFFSNNRGFLDTHEWDASNSTEWTTLYHSAEAYDPSDLVTSNTLKFLGGVKVQKPNSTTAGAITHRVFLEEPDEDLQNYDSTIKTKPEKNTISDFKFTNRTNTGPITSVATGGKFSFTAKGGGTRSYQIVIDTDGQGYNLNDDRVLEDVAIEDLVNPEHYEIEWDGKDRNGSSLPAGTYKARLLVKGGEYHFPMLDVESAPNGIKIELITKPVDYPPLEDPATFKPSMVYYDDDLYTLVSNTGSTTDISLTPRSVDSNGDPVNSQFGPYPHNYFGDTNEKAGVESSPNGAHAFSNYYGDFKGIDTWTYFPGSAYKLDNAQNWITIVGGNIAGRVFKDTNGNGIWDPNESEFKDVNVIIKDSTNVNQSTTTDASGVFSKIVAAGTVTITVDGSSPVLNGYTTTTPTLTTQTITGVTLITTSVAKDIGYAPNPVVTGTVFEDSNGNGTMDPGEVGLSNIPVSITGVTPSVNTVNNGVFSSVVAPGNVNIQVVDTSLITQGYRLTTNNKSQSRTLAVNSTVTVDPIGYAPNRLLDPLAVPRTIPKNTSVSVTVTGSDPDGDTLSYGAPSTPNHGVVTDNGAQNYTYTPNPDYIGLDSFTVTMNDGHGHTALATVTVTVTNTPPTVTNDVRTTLLNTPVSGHVTGSDSDTLETLTYSQQSVPAHGTVTYFNSTNGSYTYTPNTGYTGTDSFQVTVTDKNGLTAPGTVTVTVTSGSSSGGGGSGNRPPVMPDQTKTTPVNTPVSGAMDATDPDRDPLTYSKVSNPGNGTVVVNPDGTYTYTPSHDYTGKDTFKVEVSDGRGGRTTATVTVTITPAVPNNQPPTLPDQHKTTLINTPVSDTMKGSDPDNDPLTYSKGSDPTHGTVTVKPDGTYTYTPAKDYTGDDQFTVVVSDGRGGVTTATVYVTVTTTIPPVILPVVPPVTPPVTPPVIPPVTPQDPKTVTLSMTPAPSQPLATAIGATTTTIGSAIGSVEAPEKVIADDSTKLLPKTGTAVDRNILYYFSGIVAAVGGFLRRFSKKIAK